MTAEAGLQYIDAATVLRKQKLQFMLNIEIGNMTLGSAACCHTKDALDGIEFGQVSSYVTGIKWVNPAGELEEASEDTNPDLLRRVRSSYGLCGVIYEVTLRVKPLEAAQFTYLPRPVDELTDAEVDEIIAQQRRARLLDGRPDVRVPDQEAHRRSGGLLAWFMAEGRRLLWNNIAAFWARARRPVPRRPDRDAGAGPGVPPDAH